MPILGTLQKRKKLPLFPAWSRYSIIYALLEIAIDKSVGSDPLPIQLVDLFIP